MARRRSGQPVHGWLVLDKPEGMTSTQAVARVRRLFDAEKAGHGGTLDPLATGVLPIAFGEATKTVPYAVEGRKAYRFTVRWGEQTQTDDREGPVVATSPVRPDRAAILGALPEFLGAVTQIPPRFSAILIDGVRAYDLARDGEEVAMPARTVQIDQFVLVDLPDAEHGVFEVVCGKGTYMRALARDLALALGTVGHISALRRLAVGSFALERAYTLERLEAMAPEERPQALLPLAAALHALPFVLLSEPEVIRLRQGQPALVLRRGILDDVHAAPQTLQTEGGLPLAVASYRNQVVALVRVDGATLHPLRVFPPL